MSKLTGPEATAFLDLRDKVKKSDTIEMLMKDGNNRNTVEHAVRFMKQVEKDSPGTYSAAAFDSASDMAYAFDDYDKFVGRFVPTKRKSKDMLAKEKLVQYFKYVAPELAGRRKSTKKNPAAGGKSRRVTRRR